MNDITKALVYLNDQDLRNRRIREKRILIFQIIASLVIGLIIAGIAWATLITPYLEDRERAELHEHSHRTDVLLRDGVPAIPKPSAERSEPATPTRTRSSPRQLGYDPYALPTDLGEPDHARKHH